MSQKFIQFFFLCCKKTSFTNHLFIAKTLHKFFNDFKQQQKNTSLQFQLIRATEIRNNFEDSKKNKML